jgi:uncharacterized peroxidase-related enzyme
MARDDERTARSGEAPIIGSLPDVPGILAAMRLTPSLERHLRGLADALLVEEYPGATISRAEREIIATAVSAGNDCFYCMDSHGAFASELLSREGRAGGDLIDGIKAGGSDGLSPKVAALVAIARGVQRDARAVQRADVERALAAGATDADTQLAVLIAAGFCMYNRIVDGFRAATPPSAEAYRERAAQIAEHGYSDSQITAIPR